jgi:hypothetical protein
MDDNDSLYKLIVSAIIVPPFIAYAWRWAWRIARWKGGQTSLARLVPISHVVGLALSGIVVLGWVAVWAALAGGWPEVPASGTGMVKHPYDYGILMILYFFVSAVAATAIADRTPEKTRARWTSRDGASLDSDER